MGDVGVASPILALLFAASMVVKRRYFGRMRARAFPSPATASAVEGTGGDDSGSDKDAPPPPSALGGLGRRIFWA
eukprot:8485743-Lingulodinium_polyedra.AAC.1